MSRNTKQPIQFYRGTTAQHSGYTGPAGECTVDTTKNTLVVHDGVKAGGYPLVKEDHTVTGDGYVLANGSRSTTIGSKTLALSLDTAALKNLLADPSGTDAVAGNLKLSDAVDSSLDAATGGTAATPKAVKTAIASEASARETADTAIQKQIDNLLRRGSVIGEIRWFAMSTPPEGWLVCNGASVGTSDYPALYNAIGNTFLPKDVPASPTTFNLPNLMGKVPWGSSSQVGTEMKAGLPNITGGAAVPDSGGIIQWYTIGYRWGAIDTEVRIVSDYFNVNRGDDQNTVAGFNIDASRSSSIYGNSSTVQPPALCLLPCIRYE